MTKFSGTQKWQNFPLSHVRVLHCLDCSFFHTFSCFHDLYLLTKTLWDNRIYYDVTANKKYEVLHTSINVSLRTSFYTNIMSFRLQGRWTSMGQPTIQHRKSSKTSFQSQTPEVCFWCKSKKISDAMTYEYIYIVHVYNSCFKND